MTELASFSVLHGDCRARLPEVAAGSAQMCLTSPPYWGLRDYAHPGQIGQEETPDEYVEALLGVFREVRRVLRKDATLWLNLGDSYCTSAPGNARPDHSGSERKSTRGLQGSSKASFVRPIRRNYGPGLKEKDVVGIPWMVAFALRKDGWHLRSPIVWSKPNPMPESVKDRPTKSYEMLFLLSKSATYFYDADAIREPHVDYRKRKRGLNAFLGQAALKPRQADEEDSGGRYYHPKGRNRRDVWTIATEPSAEENSAKMPRALAELAILAGSRSGDLVFDPFCGSGTTGVVALRHSRSFLGIELTDRDAGVAEERVTAEAAHVDVRSVRAGQEPLFRRTGP